MDWTNGAKCLDCCPISGPEEEKIGLQSEVDRDETLETRDWPSLLTHTNLTSSSLWVPQNAFLATPQGPHFHSVRLQGAELDHGDVTFDMRLKRWLGTSPTKEVRGRDRGSWVGGREQAKAGRWGAACYIPERVCRRSGKRTGGLEGTELTGGVRPWRALWRWKQFFTYIRVIFTLHRVPLENVKKGKFHDQICTPQWSLWSQGGGWISLSTAGNTETTSWATGKSQTRGKEPEIRN